MIQGSIDWTKQAVWMKSVTETKGKGGKERSITDVMKNQKKG